METKNYQASYQWRRYNTDKEYRAKRKAHSKAYRDNNKELVLEKLHVYRKKNRFAATNASKIYYQKNRDKIRAYQRRYQSKKRLVSKVMLEIKPLPTKQERWKDFLMKHPNYYKEFYEKHPDKRKQYNDKYRSKHENNSNQQHILQLTSELA